MTCGRGTFARVVRPRQEPKRTAVVQGAAHRSAPQAQVAAARFLPVPGRTDDGESQPPDDGVALMTQPTHVDLAFPAYGTTLARDHGYALYSALSCAVPELHGATWLAVHGIDG